MNKSVKYYVLLPLLAISAIILTVFVGYRIYNLNSFRVYLISPDKSILVSTEFATTILIKGKMTPEVVEIFVDGRLYERRMFSDLNYTDLGNIKIANIKIDPLYLSSGNHNFTVVLKGGLLVKDSKVSANFMYEKINNYAYRTEEQKTKDIRSFLENDAAILIAALNNAREYYINSDWRKSEKYTAIKENVFKSGIDTVILRKTTDLIKLLENSSELDSIYNAANSLNLELFNKGYPYTTLMFEYRYKNGNAKSLLMSYEITDSVMLEKENIRSIVHIIKRIDGLNLREQFLGIKLPNSPFAFILAESLNYVIERYSRLFDDDEQYALREVSSMVSGFVKDNNDRQFILDKIKEESRKHVINMAFTELVKKSNAYHEIRHLNDYKQAQRIGKSVPEVLGYFYNNIGGEDFFSLDSTFKTEKEICEILLKINPEFSAYLYELVNSDGLRRLILVTLFEKIVNADKDDTSHQWAAKLILFKLAQMNGFTEKDLIALPIEGNEQNWFELLKKLLEVSYDKIETDAAKLLMTEFGG
ncbi:MAG: hypothetical protein WC139_04195 [Candidatus Kapaibacterium sp.]